ncbi:MAG: hypothetical protein KBA52_06165 [Candidatus Kapabacteria bacterium]|nr:hypothetical protein [Candidatus Kapabacteria bacterium]
MKRLCYILLIFFIIIAKGNTQVIDTVAIVKIDNYNKPAPNQLEFDMYIERSSDKWAYFANSTFHLKFDDPTIHLNSDDFKIERIATSLPNGIISGSNVTPLNGYISTEKIINDKISIGILGPDTYFETSLIPKDSLYLLGRYRITSLNNQFLPRLLLFEQPITYYQATAYKTDKDSIVDNAIIWYNTDDNIELNQDPSLFVSFQVNAPKELPFILDFFRVEYLSTLQNGISWQTKSEYNVAGYIVARALRASKIYNPDKLSYDTILSWKSGGHFNTAMIGKGNSSTGHYYGQFLDTIQYRDVEYCYRLYANFIDEYGNITPDSLLAQACVPIPNAVIVEANPSPNPFKDKTTIKYKLDDDVYLTVYVTDPTGRIVRKLNDKETGKLLDNTRQTRGVHETVFEPPPYVSVGVYEIIFIAYPIDDPSVEISRSIVKVILMR